MKASDFEIDPYDACPCNSGRKYKFCCLAANKFKRHGKFPIGSVMMYGPDDKVTTKLVAGVMLDENVNENDLIMETWAEPDVAANPRVLGEIRKFFAAHAVKTVLCPDGNQGCPHEEGEGDFPAGGDCPHCLFWVGKQGSGAYDVDDEDETHEDMPEDFIVTPRQPIRLVRDEEDPELDEEDLLDPTPGGWENDEQEGADRINAIIGEVSQTVEQDQDIIVAHLQKTLVLPCEVMIHDYLRWEVPYLNDRPWSPDKFALLKETQPSSTDRYQLLGVDRNETSTWMLFAEDIAARVQRISDGKIFVLGLADLRTVDENSPNAQILDDYDEWLMDQLW